MEQRIPLSQGETVQQFVIDQVVGFGASCLVYEAHYLDSSNHRKEVILKECYPCNADASRIGNKIIWSNAEEQEKAFLRFDNAYDIAAKIQNIAGAKSVSVYSLDKLTENGTQYVATIPNGTSYDQNESKDIADIVRTVLALTNAVGYYHKAGYLHLDIKPSNFIATEDQTGKGKNIILFDVDTVISQDDIQGGNLRSVSYSKECAAPEQKMQQIKKLCLATDLFAVGAVLFERIMNRPVDSSDSTLFSEWEFDSRFDVKKVNPKAKRLLTEIFHKTLAANVKRRYQSAEELAKALGELRDVIDSPSPYIHSYPIETNCTFVGRSSELAEIYKGLTINNRVFVKGTGGIGKTELVRKYASAHQDEYDAVVFMLYNGSVSECLNDIKLIGVDSKDRDNKSLLKEICDNDKILLILDNYDVAPNESAGLNELFELNCKVIVTTRTDFSERNPNACFVEVSGLSAEVLRRIFENGIRRELSDSEFDELKPILHIGQECTYFWSMAARLANEGAYTISEIVEKVLSGLDDLSESEDIFDTKDGKNINTTVAAAMLVLFKLDELTDKEFDVLKAMYFLDCLNMDKRQVKEMLSFSEKKLMNSFNALVKKGYIEKTNVASHEVYRISDVLRNVLEYREEFDISKSDIATGFIENKLCIIKATPSNDLTKQQFKTDYALLCLFKIVSGIKWSNANNALYCINIIYDWIVGKIFSTIYINDLIDHVIQNIGKCLERKDITILIRIKIYTILITWSNIALTGKLLAAEAVTDHELFGELRYQIVKLVCVIETCFTIALVQIETNDINDPVLIDNLCKPVVSAIRKYRISNRFSANTIAKILSINPICLQNEENDILQSFRVLCLRNNEYEKEYLKSTLEKAENTKDEDKERIAYLSIGFIALNGTSVDIEIDNELKALRKEVLGICWNMFFDNPYATNPNLKRVYLRDFSPDITPSKSNLVLMTMAEGAKLLYQSTILSDEVIEKNHIGYEDIIAITNHYPTFQDEDGKYSIDLFLASLHSIDSSDCLYYFISKFSDIVSANCNDELEKSEKQKYINASKELERKLKDISESGKFTQVFVDDPLLDYYLDYTKMEVTLNTVTAIMYDKIGDYDNSYVYSKLVMNYSKHCLESMSEKDRNTFPNNKNFEIWFLSLIMALGANRDVELLVLIFYNYIILLCDTLCITEETDERLLGYYQSLVGYAKLSKEICEHPDYYSDIGIRKHENIPHSLFSTKEDYEALIEKYTKLIEQIIGQEYHP